MANILEIIKNEIAQDYYKNNFPNDGQRFVAWYMRKHPSFRSKTS